MSPSGRLDSDPLFRETTDRFGVLRLVTEVRERGLRVRLGPIQRTFREIPADRVRDARVASYAASTYGGWHWGVRRTPGGNTVYRLRGDRGVEITLTNGQRWFVGSQRPDELAAAVERIHTPER